MTFGLNNLVLFSWTGLYLIVWLLTVQVEGQDRLTEKLWDRQFSWGHFNGRVYFPWGFCSTTQSVSHFSHSNVSHVHISDILETRITVPRIWTSWPTSAARKSAIWAVSWNPFNLARLITLSEKKIIWNELHFHEGYATKTKGGGVSHNIKIQKPPSE